MECLTVRELVHEADLGLVLITGERGVDTAILGIHLSDLEDPTPWMTSGMVLVTTGPTFASSPDVGLRLLDRLKECGAAALGVGVGHHMEHVPAAMVARAQELRIAIFESPLAVPFRTIVKYVYNSLASSDMHGLKRALALQNRLLDMLIDGRGVPDLMASLSSVLNAPIVLFDAQGNLLAPADADERLQQAARGVWAEYAQRRDNAGPIGLVESNGHRLYCKEVCVHGALERVLAATAPRALASELIDTSLSFVQRLLALDLLRAQERLIARRRMRSLLLDDFLDARGVGPELLRRLREQGIDVTRTWRLLLVGVDPWPRDERLAGREQGGFAFESALYDVVEECLDSSSISSLSQLRGESIVTLAVTDGRSTDEVRAVLRELGDRFEALAGATVSMGCSAPASGLMRVRAAADQSAEALRLARTRPEDGPLLFEELPRSLQFLNGQDPEAMAALYTRLIVPLARHDAQHHTSLLPTLRALCDNRLSAHKTAEALLIHRNTLHKRLRRIEAVLDVDLESLDDVLELHIALRFGELHPDAVPM
jgi:PucR family transcriptional regulator, purine catabolism regulatory protein